MSEIRMALRGACRYMQETIQVIFNSMAFFLFFRIIAVVKGYVQGFPSTVRDYRI